MREFQITENQAGQRFDKLLRKYLKEAPGSFIYKMLRKKNILLNDHKASGQEQVKVGDTVKLYLAEETIDKFIGQTSEYPYQALQVVYEDEEVIIIDKPSGMLSQKAKPEDTSLNEYLIGYLLKSRQLSAEELKSFRPSICNRLDRNTSGLVVAGKSLYALQMVGEMLQKRTLQKYYCCLVRGIVTERQRIEGYLNKDEKTNQVSVCEHGEGDAIITEYRPLWSRQQMTMLEVHLITGKPHQIRAHLASIGHPIAGDPKYGDHNLNQELKRRFQISTQLLHAYKVVFPECSGRLERVSERTVTTGLPQGWQSILKELGGEVWQPGIRED